MDKDQILLDIAEKYKAVYEERNELGKLLKEFEKQHNEIMGLVIGVVNQHGGSVLLKKEFMPQLEVSEYKIKWVDMPEKEGIRLEVKHFTDD